MQNQPEIDSKDFTQKDLMQFLLHSTQHVATREELEGVKKDLRADILKVETNLKADISKVDAKFDKLQWLIIATMVSVFLKDYILAFFK
ncbi:MAG: hypothetical protein HN398_08505 [Thiotrichales bacterium]|jgi:hypothetical protein|nr:hypothetical protein [Thiotrichales bacterium]MBT3348462.1 hypothetical protein [Thiotrichales bacterium]